MEFGAVEVVMTAIGVLCLVTVATGRTRSEENRAAMEVARRRFMMRMPYKQ